MKATTDRLERIQTALHSSDNAESVLRDAQHDANETKWALLYALIENDPQLAAGVCTVSKPKLRRALHNLLNRSDS